MGLEVVPGGIHETPTSPPPGSKARNAMGQAAEGGLAVGAELQGVFLCVQKSSLICPQFHTGACVWPLNPEVTGDDTLASYF